MNQPCRLSNVTNAYLSEFDRILADMIKAMTTPEQTNSISQDFIVRMIPHHRAAIEMSENLLRYTTCLPLQDIAMRIVEEQTRSIEAMQRVQPICACCENEQQALCAYRDRVDRIEQVMFSGMEHAHRTNCIECNFMAEMIPHHRGAVKMSENALRFCICSELLPILNSIIRSQRRGIMQMQHLSRCMACAGHRG